jgi:RIO-like serine/threonine protein kinase
MDKTVKEFSGHSGSKIYLMENAQGLFVRKVNNIERNLERLTSLHGAGYNVPRIYHSEDNLIDMEYIHGLDMKNYLIHNTTTKLEDFIIETFSFFAKLSVNKDYSGVYDKKLDWLKDNEELPFTKDQLIEKLPKELPSSTYHGDLTLENIIYAKSKFCMIDAVSVEYDSYIFDIAKMRQDLECKWFLRKTDVRLDIKLQNIQDKLRKLFPLAFNDNLLILMLLRVYLHTKSGDFEREFILREIKRLWK